jgi:hypothetical protein
LLTLVIASIRPLTEIYENLSLTSPFSNIFSTTILGALEEEAWCNLVRDGFTQGDESLSDKALALIEDLAGGLPFYVQMAAAMLWQYGDYEQARTEFIFQATPRFCELWNDLTPRQRQALQSAAAIFRLVPPDPGITDTLKRYGLLRPDGCLFSSAFAEFVRNQA